MKRCSTAGRLAVLQLLILGIHAKSGPQYSLPQLTTLRVKGGQSSQDPYYADYPPGEPYYEAPPTDADHLFQETVQDRVDRWREAQMAQSQNMTPLQESNPRDEQGRMKLMASVSKGSRAFIFFVLMARDIHLLEVADQTFKGNGKRLTSIPLTLLIIGNLAGVVASFTSPSHSVKKRMKAILNMDKIVETLLLGWYFLRLTFMPSKLIPKEVFVGGILHSAFFLIQCQAFTRVTWDEFGITQGTAQTSQPTQYAGASYGTSQEGQAYDGAQQSGYQGYDYNNQNSYY